MEMSPLAERVLSAIQEKQGAYPQQIAKILGVPLRDVMEASEELVEAGLLKHVGVLFLMLPKG